MVEAQTHLDTDGKSSRMSTLFQVILCTNIKSIFSNHLVNECLNFFLNNQQALPVEKTAKARWLVGFKYS